MARICDRSPCDPLLSALGNFVFGSSDGFFIIVVFGESEHEVKVEYCPFCGTRLEEVNAVIVERFTRPRRRRRVTRSAAG